MVKQLRIEFPYALYHIASRGNWGMDIFKDNEDRELFLEILSRVVERNNWICHGYCLMGNHYHLIIETPDSNLSCGMTLLNGEYSRKTNKRHKRRGHLFQGRYMSILVQKDEHFLELLRYLAFNPVKAGLVKRPEQWRWGSYRFAVSSKAVPLFLSTGFSLSFFSDNKDKAGKLLREHIEGEMVGPEYSGEAGEIVFGDTDFIEEVSSFISLEETFIDVPRKQRFISRPPLDEIFSGEYDRSERNMKIVQAVIQHGYKISEVADHLLLHNSTVSKILKNS